MTRIAICALVTGFLAVALCSIPILGCVFGLVAAGTGAFACIRASRSDARLMAVTGLVLGVVGTIGAFNREIETLEVHEGNDGIVIQSDEIRKVD